MGIEQGAHSLSFLFKSSKEIFGKWRIAIWRDPDLALSTARYTLCRLRREWHNAGHGFPCSGKDNLFTSDNALQQFRKRGFSFMDVG